MRHFIGLKANCFSKNKVHQPSHYYFARGISYIDIHSVNGCDLQKSEKSSEQDVNTVVNSSGSGARGERETARAIYTHVCGKGLSLLSLANVSAPH